MSFDVVIVGGGLAGLSLACALRDTRLRIALVEGRMPTPVAGWDARVYAITPANADFLQQIGVWKHLDAERISPFTPWKSTVTVVRNWTFPPMNRACLNSAGSADRR